MRWMQHCNSSEVFIGIIKCYKTNKKCLKVEMHISNISLPFQPTEFSFSDLLIFLQAYNVLIILGRMAQQFVLEKTTEMYSKKLRTLALS